MKQNNLHFNYQQQHLDYKADSLDKGLTGESMYFTVKSDCTQHISSQSQRIKCTEDEILTGLKKQDKTRDLLSWKNAVTVEFETSGFQCGMYN